MKIYLSFMLIFLSFLTKDSFAVVGLDVDSGYQKLKEVRRQAGMLWFKKNPELQIAAQGHADYLSNNNISGHVQSNTLSGFTGATAPDRAVNANYLSNVVSENVSAGQAEIIDSIDDLMSAIYHRFAFLDFQNNEIGIGLKANSNNPPRVSYVYNLGNHLLREACVAEQPPITGSFFNTICKSPIRITIPTYDNALNRIKARNPAMIIWPADGANDVPPAFFEESPDPLPDYSVSGYPISIQFNDFYVQSVVLNSFKLFNAQGIEITNTRILSQSTEFIAPFSDKQFALFPLERLEWDSLYQVVAQYQINGQGQTKQWSFRTRQPQDLETFTLTSEGQTFEVGSTSTFAVYIPPNGPTDSSLGQVSSSFSGGSQLTIKFADGNTLVHSYQGNVGNQATITTANGHTFNIRIVNQAPLAANQPRVPLGSCYTDGIQADFSNDNNIVSIPHLLVDGERIYDVKIELLNTASPLLFDLIAVNEAKKQDISCRSGTYSFAINELHLPDVKLPSNHFFDAELKFMGNLLELKKVSQNP